MRLLSPVYTGLCLLIYVAVQSCYRSCGWTCVQRCGWFCGQIQVYIFRDLRFEGSVGVAVTALRLRSRSEKVTAFRGLVQPYSDKINVIKKLEINKFTFALQFFFTPIRTPYTPCVRMRTHNTHVRTNGILRTQVHTHDTHAVLSMRTHVRTHAYAPART